MWRGLKKEIEASVKQQVETKLSHSTESDTRLLQFKDKLFVIKTSAVMTESIKHDITPGYSDMCTMANIEVQCDLSVVCQDQQRDENRSIIQRMKTTIEVLEADLENRSLIRREWVGGGGGKDANNRRTVHLNKLQPPYKNGPSNWNQREDKNRSILFKLR